MSEFDRIARPMEEILDRLFDMTENLISEVATGPTSKKLTLDESKRLHSKCAEMDLYVRWAKSCFADLWAEYDKENAA